jgi:uncharacterized protein (TIGR02145 family)
MTRKGYFLIQLIIGFFFFQENVFAEGSKEVWVNGHQINFYICNDNINHCNNGGDRNPFALYNCDEPDRLYFSTVDTNEVVYMGFQQYTDIGANNHVVFRIVNMLGTIVYPETTVPTSGTGYIASIAEADVGPSQIYGSSGYTAIDWHPSTPGIFYIEFMRKNSSNGNVTGGFSINLLDITVYDSVALQVKPGRLYSKAWQFQQTLSLNNPGTGYYGTNYVYTVDSIVTSAAFQDLRGGIWVQFCNQWGCANTGNFTSDRKSLYNTQAFVPEYPVFVNPPDSLIYPSATTLGQIIPPLPWGLGNCNNGNIVFYVTVNKTGSAEIDLTFGGPYTPVTLTANVVIGQNAITWNGKDGSGVNVPNNVLVTFTVKYANGLTNMPLYDVEFNVYGFIIGLVRPSGTTPLVYWDDTNIPGGTSNFTGCLSPPGCHTWNGPPNGFGNLNTINTWWYNVSTSTSPATIVEIRGPQPLTFNQTPPQSYCAGSDGVFFSVTPDPNADNYVWSYTGTGATIIQGSPSDAFITVNFAMNATSGSIQVYGTNSNCNNPGQTTSLPITIKPVPVLNPPSPNTICAGVATNITLTSVPASPTFSWTSPAPTCSANIVSCPPGQNGSNLINDLLNLTNSSSGTVVYHITSILNGCASSPQDFTLTVLPSPVPVITGNASVCLGSTGIVYSTLSGMTGYTWIVSSGGTITSGSGTNSITVNWNALGAQTVSVGYTDVNSCPALIPTIYNVTVNPLPVPVIGGPVSICATSTGNIYTTLPGMTNYLWTVSAGGAITSGGTTTDNSVTVTWNTTGTQTVSVNFNDANGCTALAPTVYSVTVNPLPVPSLSGPASVCVNSTGTYITDAGMTNYLWSVSAGGTITSGAGTNSINVLWSTNGAKTITVNYTDTICSGNSTTYSTDAGMNNYQWLISAGGTIIAGGSTTDNSVTVLWNTAGAQTISVNYIMGTGCTAASPTVLNVNVKPRPLVTNASNSTICSNSLTNIVLLASLPGTTFTWTATGSSGNVSGFSASGGPVISQTLINSGFFVEIVDYAVTPSLNGCDGPVANYIVTVDPVADAYFNPNGQTICSGGTTNISILSHVAGATFTWNGVGSSGDISGFGAGNTSSIAQAITNIGTDPGTVTYTISPSFNSCPGTPNSVDVTVDPLPDVTYTICNDAITTTAAQPFKLKGGLPNGGTYSGTGVNTGIFYPSSGIGNHTITYSYLNTWGCTANATQIITVVNPPVFACNNTITDIRDNTTYPTVKIGTQCWMAANLNYGTVIASTLMQRDNCVPEKYCFNDNPVNCVSYGGLYQWDEMMQYNNVAAEQGFCPAGWHVPTENEWATLFNFYVSNGFAGSPLKYTGYSGFNAFLSGTRFNNENWNFSNFAVMLWSSTSEGTDKAWAHGMNTFNPSVSYYPSSTTHAFNLRCIKD